MIPTLLTVTLSASVACTNANWLHSERCTAPVAEMYQTTDGFHGTLESGVVWKQTIIGPNIHRFEMEQVRWYVIGGEVIYY